jgi:hypothetical protein
MSDLSTSLSELIADNCSVVSGLALMIWDGLICFSEEKRQVWERKVTGSSLLYLVIRYGALFEYALETVDIAPNVGTQGCLATIRMVAFPDILRTVGLGLFAALRILAISGRNWTLFTVVLILCIWPIGINTYQFTTAALVIDNTYHTGCAGVAPLSDLASMIIQVLEDGTLIIAEGLVVIVTVKKTFKLRNRRGATGPRFSRLLLRDGTILFLVLALLAGFDMFLVLVTYFGPATEFVQNLCLVQNLLVSLRVVLVCRFMLNLRAICYDNTNSSGNGTLSSRLTNKLIGTLGSSLRPSQEVSARDSEVDVEYEESLVSDDPFTMGLMMENDTDSLSSLKLSERDPEKLELDQRLGRIDAVVSQSIYGLRNESLASSKLPVIEM